MKKSVSCLYRLAAIFILAALMLSGCSHHESDSQTLPACRVVTGVTVTFDDGPIHAQRHYTSSEKMRAILNYLRWIDPYGLPEEDPETAEGSSFRIVLTYSDGCEKTYLQKGNRFLLEQGQPWKKIDPTRALTLGQILGQMKSDELP